MQKKWYGKAVCLMLLAAATVMAGCGAGSGSADLRETGMEETSPAGNMPETESGGAESLRPAEEKTEREERTMAYFEDLFKDVKVAQSYKGAMNSNPIIEQHYGADPYALVYGDEVYFYMTADAYEYDAKGEIAENTYGKIRSLYVVSTKDMINFTDHGEITIAGEKGATSWAHNSWAPAAAWKEIDGKPKFFLYFADNGGGIGVVTADSPVGPFRDELGHGLIRRDMENCGNVEWLFDPAVLVDDDGRAYIYFGGGVPKGQAAHPMTARCAELGEDMMSLKGVPEVIDAPYLFEDSGIHKFGGRYYYSYCSNFSVDEAGTAEYGFENGEICVMESESPLGPFTFKERVLKNPGAFFGVGGNNHHAIFCFKDQWYITYHSRILETAMGIQKGYRCTGIEAISIAEDGTIGNVVMTKNGRHQVGALNPYETINGATFAAMGGVDTAPADEVSREYGCGNLLLTAIDTGGFVKLQGVDFGDKGATKVRATVRAGASEGAIRITTRFAAGDVAAYIDIPAAPGEDVVCEAELSAPLTGVQDVYFTFSGEGYEILDWIFE